MDKEKKNKSFLYFPGALFSEKVVKPNSSMVVVFGADGSIGSFDKSFGIEPRIVFQIAPKSTETININGRDLPTYDWDREASYHISGIIQFKQFVKNIKELLTIYRSNNTDKKYNFEFSNPGKNKKILFEIVEVDVKGKNEKYVKITYIGPGLKDKKAISISLKDPELYFFDYIIQVDTYLPMVLSSAIDIITNINQKNLKSSNKESKKPEIENFELDF